ncbi:MAG TPA: hypothetical protein VLZ83_08260 [Edaphocola sp.]|nr:hypothetical protein [Edaphocola sp.]
MRIYLDSNVFRFLKKKETDFYKKLEIVLNERKSNFLFCYSYAHLADLKRDKSQKKYDDLKYMEGFVDNNYLCHYWGNKTTSCYLVKPLEAFESLDDDSIDDLFDFESIFTGDLEPLGKAFTDLLKSQKLDFSMMQTENQPDNLKQALSTLFPSDKKEFSLLDWMKNFGEFYKKLDNDKKAFKQLREAITNNLTKLNLFDIDITKVNFNDDFKLTPLKKSFKQFVTDNLNPNGDKEISNYDFFTNAYSTLNILGLDKERNKKAAFANTINDSLHSYYAAHCDILVSDDEGLLVKSKTLYKLLDIDTQIFHIDDFNNNIRFLGEKESSTNSFIDLLLRDLEKGIVVSSYPSMLNKRYNTIIKPIHIYLGYFNRIKQIKDFDSSNYIVLYNYHNNFSDFVFYKEYEMVTNTTIEVFGTDIDYKGKYSEKDTAEIKKGDWSGRFWNFGKYNLSLEINQETKVFNLVLGPIKINSK